MPEPIDFAEHGRMLEKATPTPWRTEAAHDLWKEVRHGYGFANRMVVDCALGEDAPLIVALRNSIESYREVVLAADRALAWFDEQEPNGGGIVREGLRAALAAFKNVGEARP